MAYTAGVFAKCIFCDKEAGSKEHLWPAWMHRLFTFNSINTQEGNGPVVLAQHAEITINTVCHICNNGWMSQLEQKNVARLKPMLLNTPITLDQGGLKLLAKWTVKTAMVADSIKPRNNNEQFFTREERVAMRENGTIPKETKIWIGALTESHIGCHGTDFTIMINGGKKRIGTGSVCTIYAGHFVVQSVTQHVIRSYLIDHDFMVSPPPGICDARLVEVHPSSSTKVDWPPTPFTDYGLTSIGNLMDRWRIG